MECGGVYIASQLAAVAENFVCDEDTTTILARAKTNIFLGRGLNSTTPGSCLCLAITSTHAHLLSDVGSLPCLCHSYSRRAYLVPTKCILTRATISAHLLCLLHVHILACGWREPVFLRHTSEPPQPIISPCAKHVTTLKRAFSSVLLVSCSLHALVQKLRSGSSANEHATRLFKCE